MTTAIKPKNTITSRAKASAETTKGTTTMNTTTKKTKKAPAAIPADVATLAAQALTSIAGVAAAIPLDNVTKTQADAAKVGNLVSTAAMNLAANVLAENPALFSTIDPSVITDALAYEQAVGPLLVQVQQLAKRLASTLQLRKGNAAAQTLAVYAGMKVLSRTSAPPALAAEEAEFAKLLSNRRASRATSVTVPETTQAVRAIKATKVAAKKAALATQATAAASVAASVAANAAEVLPTVPSAPVVTTPGTASSTATPPTAVASH